MNLGLPELIVISLVVLLFFGPSRLPGLGKSIGETIKSFRKGLKDGQGEENSASRSSASSGAPSARASATTEAHGARDVAPSARDVEELHQIPGGASVAGPTGSARTAAPNSETRV